MEEIIEAAIEWYENIAKGKGAHPSWWADRTDMNLLRAVEKHLNIPVANSVFSRPTTL